MGLFGSGGRSWGGEGRLVKAARAKELAGDLAAAAELWGQANKPDEVARVLLLRADAEARLETRIALCAAAHGAAADPELKRKALARKALLSLDVLEDKGGAFLRSELSRVAKELEDAGELERAADVYAKAGDTESELRALTAAGAIERLEERLKSTEAVARHDRDQAATLRKIADLDRTAERRAALEVAAAWLAEQDDERVADSARAIRARLVRGPVVALDLGGTTTRFALGSEVTVGRGDATIVVASRAVSRRHVRIARTATGLIVEDLGTRNGTTLAGARLGGPIAVGVGVEVRLGGEIPCVVTPHAGSGGVAVEVAGERCVAPLGPLAVGPWTVEHVAEPESFVVVRTPPGATRPVLGRYQLAAVIELSFGDELRMERDGPVALRPVALPAGGGS